MCHIFRQSPPRDRLAGRQLPVPAAAEARAVIQAAGDAVAGVYASLLEDAQLPPGWVADVQLPGGLWIRPDGPEPRVSGQLAALADLRPQDPARGLIVVGLPGQTVPPLAWTAIRQALEQLRPQDRAHLRVRVIDTARSGHHLADLVAAEEILEPETPLYTAEEPPLYQLPSAAAGGPAAPGTELMLRLMLRRETYEDQFRALEREVAGLLGQVPGTALQHEALERRIAALTGAFNDLLAGPLTEEAVNLLGDMYAGLEEVARELTFAD